MSVRSGYIELDDGRLAYDEAGNGYPLVLLHGFTVDRQVWDRQFLPLSRTRRVIRYDLRGFGASSVPGETPYSHVDDLAHLLDELGLDRADLIGLSLGGGVAVDFALAHPDRVRGLVLVDPTLGGVPWSAELLDEFRALNHTAREQGVDAARARWLRHPFFAAALEHPGAAALLNEIEARYSGWHWLHRDPARALRPPAVERLAELQAPTLVIVGERDVPDIRRMAELLAKGIPGASQIVMPGAGHLPNVEVPKEFNRVLAGFLDRLDAGEASDGGERRSWVPRQDGSFDCAQDDRVNSGLTNTT